MPFSGRNNRLNAILSMQRTHPCTPEEREVCLLVLTADGYLKVLNADTGAVLKSVFLSSAINNQFRYAGGGG